MKWESRKKVEEKIVYTVDDKEMEKEPQEIEMEHQQAIDAVDDRDDSTDAPLEKRVVKVKRRKPVVKVGIREYRKGHWQVYFTYQGEHPHLQKWIDGTPLTSKSMAMALKGIIERDGYDPVKFGKDKTYNFDVASRNWVKLNRVSPEWKKERSRIVEKLFIPFFGKTDIRKIETIKIDEFQSDLQSKSCSDKYIT